MTATDTAATEATGKPALPETFILPPAFQTRATELEKDFQTDPAKTYPDIGNRSVWRSLWNDTDSILDSAARHSQSDAPELSEELYLDYTRNGRRTYDDGYHRNRSRLSTLVKAELIENKGRFLPAIEEQIKLFLDLKTWVMPAHDGELVAFNNEGHIVDLGSASTARLLSWTIHVLRPELSEDLASAVESQVWNRVTGPYLDAVEQYQTQETVDGFWWVKEENNWNAVCHAGVIMSALLNAETPAERAGYVAMMERYLPTYLDGFEEDGYCSEGLGYWNYGFSNFVMLAEFLRNLSNGKYDLMEERRIPAIASYPFRLQLYPGLYPTFADGLPGTIPNGCLVNYLTKRFPALAGLSKPDCLLDVRDLVESIVLGTAPNTFPPSEKAAMMPTIEDLRGMFPRAGVFVFRPGRSRMNIALAAKAGHNNEHHNHNDVGSYVLSHGEVILLSDPGKEVYTKRTFGPNRYDSKVLNSYGHPVPRIGDSLQKSGREHQGTIVDTQFLNFRDRVIMDITDAYALDYLKELTRTFVYDRGHLYVEITDAFALAKPDYLETALITYADWKQLSDGRILVYMGRSGITIEVTSPDIELEFASEVLNEEMPYGQKPVRFSFRSTQPVSGGSIVTRIDPASSPEKILSLATLRRLLELQKATRIQAEAFTAEKGGHVNVTAKPGSEGNAISHWDIKDHTLSWPVSITEAGNYAVNLRYCHGLPGNSWRLVSWETAGGAAVPSGEAEFKLFPTGGFSNVVDNWNNYWITQDGTLFTVALEPGDYVLKLANNKGEPLNLDWIDIVPLKPEDD